MEEKNKEEVADFFEAPAEAKAPKPVKAKSRKPPAKKKAPRKAAKKAKARKTKKELLVINIKMTKATHDKLVRKAKRGAKGNLSAWLRHSGLRYALKAGEKVQLKAA